MVSLLNDRRLAQGLPPMGFLNPFLYYAQAKYPGTFFDVTIGDIVRVSIIALLGDLGSLLLIIN